MNIPDTAPIATPLWFRAAVWAGLAWNVFGVYQYAGTFRATVATLTAQGMTEAQAAVYLSLPAWISAAFAIGVFGGLVGCVLLLMRNKAATGVLAASLAGYVVLFAGDVAYGVFAAIPSQLVILVFVVAVAAGLLVLSRLAAARGLLR